MIVTLEGLPKVEYLINDRVDKRRSQRHYYLVPEYPHLILVTQGTEIHAAMLEAMQAEDRPLVARIEGASVNNPERWRRFLEGVNHGPLPGLPDIWVKLTLFRPDEPRTAQPTAIGPWLYEQYRAALDESSDPKQLQALRAQVRALKED